MPENDDRGGLEAKLRLIQFEQDRGRRCQLLSLMNRMIQRDAMLPVAVDRPPSELVCAAVRRDPDRYLDQRITPFSTPRGLMCGPPPSRWRPLARRRWFGDLALRVAVEIDCQEKFSLAMSIIQGESALAISTLFDDLRSVGISDRALDRLRREFNPGCHAPGSGRSST